MSSEGFNSNVIKYLNKPRIKSNFSNKAEKSLAISIIPRRESEVIEFTFPSNPLSIQPIFLYCGPDLQDNSEEVAELCTALSHLRVAPQLFFIDGRKNMKEAITNFLTMIYDKVTPNPTIEPKVLHAIGSIKTSRYNSDFEELNVIGEGGFGTVYKVKCIMDKAFYAIKKIKLKGSDKALTEKIMTEVCVLATMNHQNIVRYHSAWVEECPVELDSSPLQHTPLKITEITDEEEVKRLKSQGDQHHLIAMPDSPLMRKISSDSDGSFASISDDDEPTTTVGKFWNTGGDSTDCETTDNPQSHENSLLSSNTPVLELSTSINTPVFTTRCVFIQMELCTLTLEDYLTTRNARRNSPFPVIDGEFNHHLTLQLLCALEYIHSNHIIHRDIKPGNIFLKADGRSYRVLLGDFGLACDDPAHFDSNISLEKPKKPAPRKRQPSIHSIGVGTTTYAAPEQLQSSDYGFSVDIYSTGIVLFEAYNIFSTSMERLRAIEKFRVDREVTSYMKQKWPLIVPLVLSMADVCPSRRLNATQLLESFRKGDKTTSALEEIIRNQREEIKELRKRLYSACQELAEYKTCRK